MPRAHAAGNPANVLVITGTDPYLPALLAANEAMRAEVARRLHDGVDCLSDAQIATVSTVTSPVAPMMDWTLCSGFMRVSEGSVAVL